ncbi:polysaccharide deacetylase family protein [Pseudoteredinibacter isoporae]|uniref:polysaccharide deacetylase family protein n=1 Tax=Pseudoteredinibacter isoporae TaxID=570281 RepID=UPI0033412292
MHIKASAILGFFSFICACLLSPLGMTKSLAITLDDSPRTATGYLDGPSRAKQLLNEIERHNIPQIAFFSVGKKVRDEGKERLIRYANAGHIIAHHSNTHLDFNKHSLSDYIADFEQAETQLRTLPNYKPWFRFPYLREGNTQEKRDGMRAYLQRKGYRNAYITLNNYDWYLESLFQTAVAKQQTINFDALQKLYVELIIEGIEYYDQMAIEVLGRSPHHVLLLHEMDITAMYLGDLVDALREKGWRTLPVEQAFKDEIAKYRTEKIFKFNPGRIAEIAYDQGKRKGLWHHSLDEAYIKHRFDTEVLGHDKQKTGKTE